MVNILEKTMHDTTLKDKYAAIKIKGYLVF